MPQTGSSSDSISHIVQVSRLAHDNDFVESIFGGLQEWQGMTFARSDKPNPLYQFCDYLEVYSALIISPVMVLFSSSIINMTQIEHVPG